MIQITSFAVEITPVIRDDSIKAFITWIFKTSEGDFKLKGGTIRLKSFGGDEHQTLSYDPPAIGKKFTKVIYLDNRDLYKKLCQYSIQEYCQVAGEVKHNPLGNEEVNVDEIPV